MLDQHLSNRFIGYRHNIPPTAFTRLKLKLKHNLQAPKPDSTRSSSIFPHASSSLHCWSILLNCFNSMSSEASAFETTCQRAVPQPGGKSGVDNEDLSELPFHVQSFREGLLDFIHFLGLQSTMLVAGADGDDFIPLSAYKPDGMTESQRAREREFMEGIQNLVNGARSAKNCGEWKTLIQKRLTHGMESAHNFGYVDEGGTREALLMESLVVQLCIPALHGECILNILSSERLITLNRADIGFWRAIPDPPKHTWFPRPLPPHQ